MGVLAIKNGVFFKISSRRREKRENKETEGEQVFFFFFSENSCSHFSSLLRCENVVFPGWSLAIANSCFRT